MVDEIFDTLRNSKCEKDYKGQHCWMKLGLGGGSDANLILRCSQCWKCIGEPLEFLDLGDNEFQFTIKDKKAYSVINYFMRKAKNPSKLSLKRLHTMLFQTYYLAFKAGSQKEGNKK